MVKTQTLHNQQPIVDPQTGRPSEYFMRTIQETGLLTDGNTDAIVTINGTSILAGDGLDGGGLIGDGDITLTADVQEILDQVSTTQGVILYRGASGWAPLAPGTSGHFLKTLGAGANPEWDAAAAGSGTVTSVAASGASTGFSFTGSPITTTGTLTLTISNAATVRSQLGLVIGTNVQAYDADLAAIATLSTEAFGRSLLTASDLAGLLALGLHGQVAPTIQAGTSYTAVLGDAGGYIQFTNGAAVTFTIPPNSSVAFPIGTVIAVEQNGAGVVTFTAGAGTTLRSRGSFFATSGQYAVAQVKKVDTDIWTIIGDVS